MNRNVGKLNEADRLIQEIAREAGLDFMPQEFDVVPAQKMLEIMAYRLPVNFSHWSFGRDYEIERTKLEHGYAVPYEVVFNSDPCRAYLMDTNPFVIQVMVMAHVYAHNDFMKNNRHFQNTRRDMISSASEAAARFRKYEEDFGPEAVERIIDAAMAIQWNIDPDEELHPETEPQARERLFGWSQSAPHPGAYDDLLLQRESYTQEEKTELRRKTPPEPTVDLVGYVIDHSPRQLSEWQKDILQVVKSQAQYFMPYRRTKIMNEGWATYWHEEIMKRLFAEKFLDADEHGYYNIYNARVKAHHPKVINPYLLGSSLFRSIEERWNKGRFGREYEEARYIVERENWDRDTMKGREKISNVRRTHMDWFFVDEFLDREVIEDLKLYYYREKEGNGYYEYVVDETEWKKVKRIIVKSLMNWGVPRILVEDGNYRNSLQLYLRHQFEGFFLDEEYCRKTLEYIQLLWDRPVHLETVAPRGRELSKIIYTSDEKGVHLTAD
jgi:stage V sporulation protein R